MNLFVTMLGVGLITSIHCVFMCGGLVLTYAVKGAEDGPWYRRLIPHLVYQGAKIASYATVALVLGAIVALVGKAIDITGFRNWLMVFAGVYMVLLGIGMTGKVAALRHLTPRPPKFLMNALSKNRKRAVADAKDGTSSLATPLTFGLMTGLMPCAPLIAAQAAAMAAGSPALGALAMIGFGLGTAPLMLLFGFASSLLSKRFQAKLQIVAAIAVTIFGLVIFNRGLMVVGSPVNFNTVKAAVVGTPQSAPATAGEFKKGKDGVVEIPLTIANVQFQPSTVSLPANTPVRLIVDRKEANACSAQLAIPQAGVLANLKDNAVTVVDVPAMPAGSYTLTCGMGMMAGSVSVGGAGASASGASGSQVPLLPFVLLLVAGGGYAVYRVRTKLRAEEPVPVPAPSSTVKGGKTAPAGKGSAASRRGSGRTAPAPEPAGVTYFGFSPTEIFVAVLLVGGSVLTGLALGGFFH